jgi:hypothetical protein
MIVSVGSLRNGCATIGISQPSQHDMLRDKAESDGSGEPVLNRWITSVRSEALRRPILKRKKGFVTISFGLIYHSMVSYQPPSRDTVPLIQHIVDNPKVETYVTLDPR